MKAVRLVGALIAGALLMGSAYMSAEPSHEKLVRIAELEIDASHLVAFKIALREEIEASIRIEPGVLSLYAVSIKDQPNQIRLFEVYASTAAYQAHLQSKHFLKYKAGTAHMVKSLKLIETEPVLLGAK